MHEKLTQLLADSLLKVWSERDGQKRLNVMEQIYAPDIVFYESSQGEAIKGHQAINELIQKLQTQWPSEFVFRMIKPVVINHGISHVSWTLGPAHGIPVTSGMDIAIIEGEVIKYLYLYLDEPTN